MEHAYLSPFSPDAVALGTKNDPLVRDIIITVVIVQMLADSIRSDGHPFRARSTEYSVIYCCLLPGTRLVVPNLFQAGVLILLMTAIEPGEEPGDNQKSYLVGWHRQRHCQLCAEFLIRSGVLCNLKRTRCKKWYVHVLVVQRDMSAYVNLFFLSRFFGQPIG